MNNSSSLKSSDYDEKIKKLLDEGRKLGAVCLNNNESKVDESKPAAPVQPGFSNEVQKLKQEIEEQNKKTVLLQNEIKMATDACRANPASYKSDLFRPSLSSLNSNSNNNTNLTVPPFTQPLASSSDVIIGNQRPLTSSNEHLQKALESSQVQVDYLTRKLDEAQRMAEKQKTQFRSAVEELQMKLQETVTGRKKLIELRENEMAEQEVMIERLQTTVKELAAANQMQEQSLIDANERMQMLEKRSMTADDALGKIKMLLSAQERGRNRTSRFSDRERLSDISPEFLVEYFERFLNDSSDESGSLRNKILQLETEICEVRENHEREVNLLSDKQRDAAEGLKNELNEKILDEKLNTDNALKQVYSLQEENQQQRLLISSKEQEIRNIEKQLTIVTTQFDELKGHYYGDKDSLQSKLRSVEKEMLSMKEMNEVTKNECEHAKQQLTSVQENFIRTNEELKSEREQRRNLWIKENQTSKELNELRQQLEEKSVEVTKMKERISDLRAELSTKVVEHVRQAELAERSKADNKITLLTEDVTRFREELSSTKAILESTERQISDVMVERTETFKSLQDKNQQFDRISSQCNVAERKLAELTQAKKNVDEKLSKIQTDFDETTIKLKKSEVDHDRLKCLSEEKDKLLVNMRHQVESLTSEVKSLEKEMDEVKGERSKLKSEVEEKARTAEELRALVAVNDKTISDYENRIGELIREKKILDAGVHSKEEERVKILKVKEEMKINLKEAKYQISQLTQEREEIMKQKTGIENASSSEQEKLKKQIRHLKRNLHEAEKSLRTIKSVDGRAAKIAADMQKEVTDKRSIIDSLKSELSKAFDKLSFLEKENKNLKTEFDFLTEKHEECEASQKNIVEELRQKTKTEKGYKTAVERLEKALEKAAIRNASAQSRIENQEQEIEKIHIKHNLDLMNKREEKFSTPDPSSANNLYKAIGGSNLTQQLLARMMINMTSQPTVHDVTDPQNIILQQMVKDEPINANKNLQVSPKELNTDIYQVLAEVRDHLAKINTSTTQTNNKVFSKTKMKKRNVRYIDGYESESSELPVVTMTSDTTSVCSLSAFQTEPSMMMSLRNSYRDFSLPSSPYKSVRKNDTRMRTTSPVTDLLGDRNQKRRVSASPKRKKSPKRISISNPELRSPVTNENTTDLGATNTSILKNAITNTAEDLCLQLQQRLEGLSKMGGKLQKQNKMTERIIRKQDEKLQKVRGGIKFR